VIIFICHLTGTGYILQGKLSFHFLDVSMKIQWYCFKGNVLGLGFRNVFFYAKLSCIVLIIGMGVYPYDLHMKCELRSCSFIFGNVMDLGPKKYLYYDLFIRSFLKKWDVLKFPLGGGQCPQQFPLSNSNSFYPIFTKLGQKLFLDNM